MKNMQSPIGWLLCSMLFLGCSLLIVPPSMAQTEAPETAVIAPSPLASISPEINSTELRRLYITQFDDYRTIEKQAQVAITQYQTLNTLVSLEQALQLTHRAMELRSEVLVSYLELVRRQLQQATGISVTEKSRVLEELATDNQALRDHQTRLLRVEDRQALNQEAALFAPLAAKLESDVGQAQTLMTVGRLLTIYDKSVTLQSEIEAYLQTKDDVHASVRARASQEIKSTLAEVKMSIDTVNASFQRTDGQYSNVQSGNAIKELSGIFVGLSQTLSYFEEILKI